MTTSPHVVGTGSAQDDGPQPWWKTAVVYQIWPRSFTDGDGDGIGDLAGISGRLDYLVELGVDMVWLSPIYPSPHDDADYDISGNQDIDSTFGSLEDFDYRRLIELRHTEPTVAHGDFTMLLADHEQVYAFTRRHGDTELLVLGDFSGASVTVEIPDAASWLDAELLLANVPSPDALQRQLTLQPWEARVHRRRRP
jgi:glycosidase